MGIGRSLRQSAVRETEESKGSKADQQYEQEETKETKNAMRLGIMMVP
jgi:hypothetical protein